VTINREGNCEILVDARREQIPVMLDLIEREMVYAGFDTRKTMEVLLAVEEAATNITNYAYSGPKEGEDGKIRIKARAGRDHMEIIIEDWGVPFDPTARSITIPDDSAEDRPIGGLGIHLIRSYVDSIAYRFIDGKNTLFLTKNL